MKKINEIVGVVFVLLSTLCSCSSDSVEQVQMLKKIVEISADDSSNTTSFVYDANKIKTIDKVDKLSTFYYTGDLITKVEEFDKLTKKSTTLEYNYTSSRLTKIISSDKSVINYVYNSDGSVSYEKISKSATNADIKNYYGTLYFQNENLVKDEKNIDDAIQATKIVNTISIKYDSKKNPLTKIVGFSKLLNYSKAISANNDISTILITSVTSGVNNQSTSSANRVDSKYQYNSNGYPTEIQSENIILGDSDSKHVSSQLFYN